MWWGPTLWYGWRAGSFPKSLDFVRLTCTLSLKKVYEFILYFTLFFLYYLTCNNLVTCSTRNCLFWQFWYHLSMNSWIFVCLTVFCLDLFHLILSNITCSPFYYKWIPCDLYSICWLSAILSTQISFSGFHQNTENLFLVILCLVLFSDHK
jgi:hypothetical protein